MDKGPGGIYALGDVIQISFTVPYASYIQIFREDESGQRLKWYGVSGSGVTRIRVDRSEQTGQDDR